MGSDRGGGWELVMGTPLEFHRCWYSLRCGQHAELNSAHELNEEASILACLGTAAQERWLYPSYRQDEGVVVRYKVTGLRVRGQEET